MKKVIIGLSGLVILAFVVILFTNAQATKQEVKKATTEVSKDCAKCPTASTCTKMNEAKGPSANTTAITPVACDPAKCKDAKCDMTKCKEGKCDPATCKAKCEAAKGDMKSCDMSKCPMKAAVK
jgi:cytoskeletal protein RodZ